MIWAAHAVLVCLIVLAAPVDAADNHVRERRLIRAEPTRIERMLALPATALEIGLWPLKKAVLWAEDVRLDRRIVDVVRSPSRLVVGREDEP